MGRGGRNRSRTQRKHFQDGRENVWKKPKSDPSVDASSNPNKTHWEPFATQNPAFDEYYKVQGIVSPEEWDVFMGTLRKPLPAAFRINSGSQFCDDIRKKLEDDFVKSLQAEAIEGGELEAMKPLPWYPNKLAWHSNFSRMQIRKNKTLERFHEFLKLENETGNITRQEAVSMVPPLFLDVQPDHFVLDMCAAPGSKTFQLLEIIHQSTKAGSLPEGMVVANDPDVQRCNLLIHQTKRMCTANLLVTNHDGQQFPGCRSNKNGSNTSNEIELDSNLNQLLFDRVLCDVPCSGDGTLRKAPDIWRKWNTGMGNGVHNLQVLIAMRGITLLKVGGKMVYSTCSMNPVEDEAVVAEILRRCAGSVELLDVSSEVPELVRRPGLRKWKVRDRSTLLTSGKDVPRTRRSVILSSMFPSGRSYKDLNDDDQKHENGEEITPEDGCQPMDDSVESSDELVEEISDLPLERCMRILPHDQNTGAFFIAVLQKVSPLPAAVQEKTKNQEAKSPTTSDEQPEKLSNEIIEDKNGLENDSTVGPDDKTMEAASQDNLIDNEADKVDALEGEVLDTNEEHVLAENREPVVTAQTESGNGGVKRKLQMQGRWKGVDPVVFFNDETVINSIKTFYGIDESFPINGHLIARNSDTNHVKRIYYVAKSVKDVLELNLRVGQQLKISSVGLKMFERQTSREGTNAPCSFRISSEGLPVLLPYVTKQILHATPVDLKHLLQYKSIKFSEFVDAQFGEKAANLMMGCCIIVLTEGGKDLSDTVDASTIAIGCWKGRASLTVMVTAIDCEELLEKLVSRMGTEEGTTTSIPAKDEQEGNETIDETESVEFATAD